MVANYELAKNFALGQRSGKGSNMFIEDDTIYSYGHHFPIAKRIGFNKYLFNSDEYSNSTSKHKSYVLHSFNYDDEIIHIKDCDLENADIQLKENLRSIDFFEEKKNRAYKHKQYYEERIKWLKSQNELISKYAIVKAL